MGIGNFSGAHVSDYDSWGDLGVITSIPTGIVNASTTITVSYSTTAPHFTITPVDSTFTYYLKGVRYVVSDPLTYTFGAGGNPVLTEGTWYFYLDSTKTVHATKVTGPEITESLILSYALCGLGYWDSTDSVWMIRGWEGHGPGMGPVTHAYLHDTFGARWETGLALSDFTIAAAAPTGDANSQFSYTAGGIHDEDINFVIPASTAPASFPVWYREGTGNWRFQAASNLPVIYDGSTRLRYNSVAGGVWGQTTVGQGNYVLCHVFATTDSFYPVVCIQGQAEYTLTASAYAGAIEELKSLYLVGLPTPELVPIGTVMYQTNSTWVAATKHCKIVYVNTDNDVYVDWREQDRLGGGSSGEGTSDHSALSNLDYASAGHTGFQAELTTGNLTATSPIVLDQERQVIGGPAVISLSAAYAPRERLTANRTYYVRTDGNDSNSGLVNSAAGAFRTIQAAVNAYQSLDCNGYDVTIQVADGTYTDPVFITYRFGAGNLYLLGNLTTPSNVLLSTTATTITLGGHPSGSHVYIRGFKIQSSTESGILSYGGPMVFIGNLDFGPCATAAMYPSTNSYIRPIANYTISGGGQAHVMAGRGGGLMQASPAITVTLTGTPNFSSAFAVINEAAACRIYNITFSGSATGKRYDVTMNGVLNVSGNGATYLPGNSAGTTATGGQYL